MRIKLSPVEIEALREALLKIFQKLLYASDRRFISDEIIQQLPQTDPKLFRLALDTAIALKTQEIEDIKTAYAINLDNIGNLVDALKAQQALLEKGNEPEPEEPILLPDTPVVREGRP